MLKQRIITAIIMMLVISAALTWLPPFGFTLFVAGIILAGAWEWSRLLKLGKVAQGLYLLGFAALLLVLMKAPAGVLPILMGCSLAWWLLALILVLRYPQGGAYWQKLPVLLLISGIVLLPSMAALMALRSLDHYGVYILVFIALVAAADIGAYFSGKAFGKRKLAPLVSPNKTWAGFFGGMIACVGVGALALWQLSLTAPLSTWQLVVALALCLILAVLSVVGDLFESMLKRHCHEKDSSWLLPGHGGVLDRLDSITAAVPVYILILLLLELL